MTCPNCRNEIPEGSAFCNNCGAAVSAQNRMQPYAQPVTNTEATQVQAAERKGFSIASMVLGITSLILWLIPLLGFPATITGLVLGILGRKRGARKMAIAGIILCVITLLLTLTNSILGAYLAVTALQG